MAEAQAATAAKKERVAQMVKMSDGRDVEFVGTARVKKDWLKDDTKIQLDEAGGMLVIQNEALAVRMDLISGDTRTIPIPLSLFADFAGHGGVQKFGDTLAAPKEKPLSTDDMLIALDDLAEAIAQGKWSTRREGDGFAGASIVIKAIVEASPGKTVEDVKAFLNKKLEASKAAADASGGKLKAMTRKELYDSFRHPDSKVGKIIERMEREQRSKTSAADADAALEEFAAAA